MRDPIKGFLFLAWLFLAPSVWAQGGTSWNDYSGDFDRYVESYRPSMGSEEAAELKTAIWEGCFHDGRTARWALSICAHESSLKVRRFSPEAPNRTDYMGAHYNVLFVELRESGLFPKEQKIEVGDAGYLAWKRFFEEHPDFGTLLACRRFSRLCQRFGPEDAVQIWNAGKPGTARGLIYLACVRADQF